MLRHCFRLRGTGRLIDIGPLESLRVMAAKGRGGSSAKFGAMTLTGLSAVYGATRAASAFVAPAAPLRMQVHEAPLVEPLRQSIRAPAASGACLALGAAGVAAAAFRRQSRPSRAPRLAEPQQPQPGREPEIDPRRSDPPNTAPPVRMPVVDTGSGEKLDVMSKLLEDRIIILGGEVKDEMAQILVAQMLYLANSDPSQDITMYINSPGGSVSAGMVAWQISHGSRKTAGVVSNILGSFRLQAAEVKVLQIPCLGSLQKADFLSNRPFMIRCSSSLATLPGSIFAYMVWVGLLPTWLRTSSKQSSPGWLTGEHSLLWNGCFHGLILAVCRDQGQAHLGEYYCW